MDPSVALTCLSPLPQLKKPVMEKLCRDRINSCIEELSVIIGKEFHKEERKLVKADILEMTVNFLRQQLQAGVCQGDYSQGYSHCWRDSMRFLSSSEALVPPRQGLQRQDQKLQRPPAAAASGSSRSSPGCRLSPAWSWAPASARCSC
uniref:Hairy-related 12 n=1 Tax=Amphiprion percula TaxID=161767 RepID=A0A3P8T303_AMPPE